MTIKLKSLLKENNILIPRKLENRAEKQKQIDFQRIQGYVNNGSKGYLDLTETSLTKLPDNLTKVEGDLHIGNSNIEDLNNLEYVGGGLWANNIKIKSLPENLTKIGGVLSVGNCAIDNIDNVKYVGGGLWIYNTNISELPEGLRVGGALYCSYTPLAKRFPDKPSFEEYLKERNITCGGDIIF